MTVLDGHQVLDRRRVAVGALLAEGGEGRVHEVVGRPQVLYKAFRRPVPLDAVAPLLAWRRHLAQADPGMADRVTASTAWPTAAVVDDSGVAGTVSGLVIPRAPERFSIRHRDGVGHLATLSYLTADPRQRSAAYGLALPPAASPPRIALVYALARLLEAFTAGPAALAHGDLSTKNILWSLRAAPEVYLLDCDSSRLFGADGKPLDARPRPQVATPNWDDPAAALSGADPGPLSDRYSLGLIFLRVVGAAHYPIQARQKRGEEMVIDFEIPPWGRRAQRLGRDAEVWDVCGRALGVRDPDARPDASEWVRVLEATLRDVGAAGLVDAVCAAQGGSPKTLDRGALADTAPATSARGRDLDVIVRAVTAEVRPEHWRPQATIPAPRPADRLPVAPSVTAVPAAAGRPKPSLVVAPSPPVLQQVKKNLRVAWRWWLLTHRRTLWALRSPGRRRRGVRRLVFCAATDFAGGCVALFLVAMIVSPLLGI
ncbi:MAG: hypothetical protein M3063_11310 [Actinomycetota bacterium]|nr:hypothetical protein [Actinomycetota bacterium]MDQ6946333.1 hypothetical protein [Actinomycetota bacterium]